MSVNFIKATPSEPTIDEMIAWLGELRRWVAGEPVRELEAIRAFAERAKKRAQQERVAFAIATMEELAAMESDQ
jgi:hypothetical protein